MDVQQIEPTPPQEPGQSRPLDEIASEIRARWAEARAGEQATFERHVDVGHLLRAARVQFAGDAQFGRWFKAQDFGFTRQWAWQLQSLARHEQQARDLLTTAVVSRGVNALVAEIRARNRPAESSAAANESKTPRAFTPLEVVVPGRNGKVIRLRPSDRESRRAMRNETIGVEGKGAGQGPSFSAATNQAYASYVLRGLQQALALDPTDFAWQLGPEERAIWTEVLYDLGEWLDEAGRHLTGRSRLSIVIPIDTAKGAQPDA